MSYTLAAAAAACGLNKSTVLRAIKAGKISGTKDEHGEWHIEAAELHRVYPPVVAAAAGNGALPRDAMSRAPCHTSRSLPSRHLNMVPRIRIRRQGSCQASAEHF